MCLGFITTFIEQLFVYADAQSKDMKPSIAGEPIKVHTSDGQDIECCVLDERYHKTILLFHGNGGNISTRREVLILLQQNFKCNVVCFDYRGFGRSTGSPSEAGIMKDVHAVLQMMGARFKPPFIFLGRSLGGAVASRAAYEYPHLVSHLILENAFQSVAKMAHPNIQGVASFFLKNCWRTDRYIRDLNIPVMVIVSENDEVVPPEHGKYLFEICNSAEKRMVLIKSNHSDAPLKREYNILINDFIS